MWKRGISRAAVLILTMSVTASAQEWVRSTDARLLALTARANAESPTFRRLSNAVNTSDGTVYIEPGSCGRGFGACLAGVTVAGGRRILWVRVDMRKDEIDLIASIGHELAHAIEVLDNRTVTTNAALHLFYVRHGVVRGSGVFETAAAVKAGIAVREEIRTYRK